MKRVTSRVLIALAAAALLAGVASADRGDQAAATATVSGIVTTGAAPGRPLRRVTVTLQASALRAPISAVTGDDGRFVLTGIQAGQYLVRASRPGYVDTVLGAPPGGILGAPVVVGEGEHVTGLAIHLPPGGVITGTVRHPDGRPARDARLQVAPVRTVDGRRRVRFNVGLGMVETDDRGIYRRFGLPPGEYIVQLMVGAPGAGAEAVRRTSADEVAWAERLVDDSSGPGAGARAGATSEPPPGPTMAPAPIYYPGTTSLETARVITLDAGEEQSGIDLVIEHVPAVRVSGIVRDPQGQPQAGVTVRLNDSGDAESMADMLGALIGRGARTDANGAFTIDDVPPGEYEVAVSATRAGAEPETGPGRSGAPDITSMFAAMFGRSGAGVLHAAAPVVVAGADVGGVELLLAEGSTVSGRVVFEGTAEPPAPSTIHVMLAGVSGGSSPVEQAMSMMQGTAAPVTEDRTFAVRGVPPNQYRVTVTMPGGFMGAMLPDATWVLKSVVGPDGADLADTPFDLSPGRDLEGLVITLTDRPAVISGSVIDAAGRPVSAFPILIFSTDPSHWIAGSRRVQMAQPASDGTYKVSGLPAGEYYVGAVTAIELDDLYDPSFLQQVAPIAFRITIADGETKEQDLRIGG